MAIRRSDALVLLVLALAAGAVTVVGSRTGRPARGAERSRDFQRLVLGLGLGPATDLLRDESAFDPRVGSARPARFHPIPAGDAFCPDRAAGTPTR